MTFMTPKWKTLSCLRHKQFIISYSSVVYIEESDSLELKVLRETEEFEFKGSWKAMAIFKTDCAKLLLYNPVFLLLDPKMCIWKHACKCMMISSLSSYFSYYWSFIFAQFWQYLCVHTVWGFSCIFLLHLFILKK